MKKIIFIAMVLCCAFANSFAQGKCPKAVQSAFNQQFPKASQVKWDKEANGAYEASFGYQGQKLSANYSPSGEWLETERPIGYKELPEAVQRAFEQAHKGAKVKAAAQIESKHAATKYEIEVKRAMKTVEYFYSADGTVVK